MAHLANAVDLYVGPLLPGIYEACVGLTLRELIYDLGCGVAGGELLGVIPGGSSCPVLLPTETVNAPDDKAVLHPWHGKSVLDVGGGGAVPVEDRDGAPCAGGESGT